MTTFFDIRDEFNKNGEVLIATDIENGNKFILNEDIDSPQITDYKGKKCFIEKLMDKTKIVVAGAGHVSMDFARVAEILGFDLIIIDDRAEFANSERFPNAQIICGNIGESLKADFGKNVYYVIMTRGHKDDYEALKTILGKEYKYVGMIGSRKKVAFVKDKLKNDGFTDEDDDSGGRSFSESAFQRQRSAVDGGNLPRSEERRVGKECRSRWSPYH